MTKISKPQVTMIFIFLFLIKLNYTGCFFSWTNTNITITQKVMDRISIGLKRFEEEGHCYKMVKLDQKFFNN